MEVCSHAAIGPVVLLYCGIPVEAVKGRLELCSLAEALGLPALCVRHSVLFEGSELASSAESATEEPDGMEPPEDFRKQDWRGKALHRGGLPRPGHWTATIVGHKSGVMKQSSYRSDSNDQQWRA